MNTVDNTAASPALEARTLMRRALKGSLGTLDVRNGHPYVSLVTVATEPDGTPLLLISRLALHTRNLERDGRATLMLDGTSATGDPLAGGRVTLIGRAEPTASPAAKARFLARHPAAAVYADFPDFAFYALNFESAHFIGGFGRIVDLPRASLLVDMSEAAALAEAEAEIVEHMNDDHADAVALYASQLGKVPGSGWRMTGLDPEGLDLVGVGEAVRLRFAARVTDAAGARVELVRMAKEARERAEVDG